MLSPIDQTFGKGTSQKLVDAVTIDGDVPSIVESWTPNYTRIAVLLVWTEAKQMLALDIENMHVSWIVGMCDTLDQGMSVEFTAKVAGATMPLAKEFGFTSASALAYNQMAAFLQSEGMQETQGATFVADLTDNTFLQEYRPDA